MRRTLALLIIPIMLLGMLAACTNEGITDVSPAATAKATTQPTPTASPTEAPVTFDGGKTNAEGLPIVNEPIELEVAYVYAANYGDANNYLIWDQLSEATGINFTFRVLADTENLNLMYASQDYPDLGWFNAVPSNAVWDEAVQAGDIIDMKPYLDAGLGVCYTEFFEQYPLYKAMATYSDGGIYFLPSASPEETTHRDVWLINQIYLDQLDLAVPTTLDELTDYFRAIRDNAGTGDIPKDVIPFYYLFKANANASFEDIYTAFGLTQGLRFGPYIEDGVVKHNLTNEALKEAIKYQAMLYSEGLTSPQAFTDDNSAMALYLQSTDPTMTGFLTYNDNRGLDHWTHMAPVTADSNTTAYTRKRNASVGKGCVVYAGCEYPAAVVRYFQYIHDDNERWLTVLRGQEGVAWEENANGYPNILITSIANLEEPDKGFTQTALVQNPEKFEFYTYNSKLDPKQRLYQYVNLYDNYLLPDNIIGYPGIPSCYTDQSVSDQNTEISNNVWTYANEMLANWVMGEGDVDAQWDTYVETINGYGWETYLTNLQDSYDSFMASLN